MQLKKEIRKFYALLILSTVLTVTNFDIKVFAEEETVQTETKDSDAADTVVQEEETPDELKQLYAQSACLLDADSGRVLYAKNGEEQKPMASTTKIMTCIVALENGNLDDIVTFSDNAAKQPDVQLNGLSGEQFTLKNLLYSLMLESHNDTAVAIAEHIGGSVEGFACMMNQKAMDIGCEKYHFVSPNGLDSSDNKGEHSISAVDLARILRYCIKESPKKDEFLEITRTPSISFSNVAGSRTFSCTNHNAFLQMMDGALTGKTGFTGKAGYCYVGAVEQDGKTLIVALLGCGWPHNKTYKWSDTKKLMNYGFSHYTYQNILNTSKTFDPVYVKDGIPKNKDLTKDAYTDLAIDFEELEDYSILLREGEQVTIKYDYPIQVEAPINAGDVVGYAHYMLGDEELIKFPIYVKTHVKKLSVPWCMRTIFDKFLF